MPASDNPLTSARRARLQAWIESHFNNEQTSFINHVADPAKRVNQGMLSSLLKPNGKSFGEKLAARLEELYSMPTGYLVKATDEVASQPPGLDLDILRVALIALREAATAEDKEIDLYQSAPVIAYAYRERAQMKRAPSKAELKAFDAKIREQLRGGDDGVWKGRTAGDGQGSDAGHAATPTKGRRRTA